MQPITRNMRIEDDYIVINEFNQTTDTPALQTEAYDSKQSIKVIDDQKQQFPSQAQAVATVAIPVLVQQQSLGVTTPPVQQQAQVVEACCSPNFS
ncbi:MAG: hypothetical protein H0W88_03940 [Parachlamydiaceae bacterium]|nr:hypothetical protein [Parachlamydiaceae bacterium]